MKTRPVDACTLAELQNNPEADGMPPRGFSGMQQAFGA
jgi:hypothetical protein